MRNRTPNSNTAPATAPTTTPADSWFWFITEKGLRASGAASMKSTAADLRRAAAELEKAAHRLTQDVPTPPNGAGEAPVQDVRRGKVCYRYRNERQVPDLRLGGQWLERAGFELGQQYQVQVHLGQLTIRAEPANKEPC